MLMNNNDVGEVLITAPAETTTVATVPAPDETEMRVLGRLLRMADDYHGRNAMRQAEEMYLELVEYHPSTPQAQQARDQLLMLCDEYERNGKLHHARWLYEQLV